MPEIEVPCPTCSGTANMTPGGGRNNLKDRCTTCGGRRKIPARPGESRETSWPFAVPGAVAVTPDPSTPGEYRRRPDGPGLSLRALRAANIARQAEWCPDQVPDLSFRGCELAGEVGEVVEALTLHAAELARRAGLACNIVKKLERERHQWAGSRATLAQLRSELSDLVICADLTAITAGLPELGEAVAETFNATSRKVGMTTLLPEAPASPPETPSSQESGVGETEGWQPMTTPAAPAGLHGPVAWVIPGDDGAKMDGFIDAKCCQEGEFTLPLYEWRGVASPPTEDGQTTGGAAPASPSSTPPDLIQAAREAAAQVVEEKKLPGFNGDPEALRAGKMDFWLVVQSAKRALENAAPRPSQREG